MEVQHDEHITTPILVELFADPDSLVVRLGTRDHRHGGPESDDP
jgi:hypothetical protein